MLMIRAKREKIIRKNAAFRNGNLPEEVDDSMEMIGYYVLLTAVFVGAVLVYSFANLFRKPSLGERNENGDSSAGLGTCHGSTPEK